MAVMDEFREEREAIKNAPFRKKLNYFWDYYKWHSLIALAVVVAIGSIIYNKATAKDNAIFALCVNSVDLSTYMDSGIENTFLPGFETAAGINTDEEQVMIDASLNVSLGASADVTSIEANAAAIQKIMAYTAAGKIDVMVTDSSVFTNYAYQDYFHDLRDFLPEDLYEKYEPHMFYIDAAVLKATENASVESTEDIIFPDPDKPEEMEEPIPVGIYLQDAVDSFYDTYAFDEIPPLLGFIVNGQHPETSIAFLEYIMEGTCDPIVVSEQ